MAISMNLDPRQMVNTFRDISSKDTERLVADALKNAGATLQQFRSFAGTPKGSSLKTMAAKKNDADIGLSNLDAYTKLSGRVPQNDTLKTLGLDNVFGDLAGQDTYDTQMDALALAMKAAKGSGGRSGSSKTSHSDIVNAIRTGAVTKAREQLAAIPWDNGQGADKAAQWATDLLWQVTPENPIPAASQLSGSEYQDVINQIYRSVGKTPPNLSPQKASSGTSSDNIAELLKQVTGEG